MPCTLCPSPGGSSSIPWLSQSPESSPYSCRLPRGAGQRLLRVRDPVQPDALRQGDVIRQDTKQGVGQIPRQEIQQDGAVHRVSPHLPSHARLPPEFTSVCEHTHPVRRSHCALFFCCSTSWFSFSVMRFCGGRTLFPQPFQNSVKTGCFQHYLNNRVVDIPLACFNNCNHYFHLARCHLSCGSKRQQTPHFSHQPLGETQFYCVVCPQTMSTISILKHG